MPRSSSRPINLTTREEAIAGKILKEVRDRLGFLNAVGVGYLTLDRNAASLSGGEAQRIRLATQIGSKLMGVLYVLDEPSIGLHQRDNRKLIDSLLELRDLGNTVIVVEHDEETIETADHIIDLGPRAGVHGGELVAEGTLAQIKTFPKSLTAKYLRGEATIAVPEVRRPLGENKLVIRGARQNNLKNLDVDDSARRFHRRHRRERLRQVDAGQRHPLQGALAAFLRCRRYAGRARSHRRAGADRQGDRHRSVADRPHAALESGDVHAALRRDPQSDGGDAGSAHARLRAGALFVQREGRPLRGVQGRRADQDRDALHARHLREVRCLPAASATTARRWR